MGKADKRRNTWETKENVEESAAEVLARYIKLYQEGVDTDAAKKKKLAAQREAKKRAYLEKGVSKAEGGCLRQGLKM